MNSHIERDEADALSLAVLETRRPEMLAFLLVRTRVNGSTGSIEVLAPMSLKA